jgi:hypothetical protein
MPIWAVRARRSPALAAAHNRRFCGASSRWPSRGAGKWVAEAAQISQDERVAEMFRNSAQALVVPLIGSAVADPKAGGIGRVIGGFSDGQRTGAGR